MRNISIKGLLVAVCLVLVLGAGGCQKSSIEAGTSAQMAMARQDVMKSMQMMGARSGEQAPGDATALAALVATQPDRYLIKNARIVIEVENPREAANRIVNTAKDTGGYTADLQEQRDSLGRSTITVQVRMPSDQFETYMTSLEGLGKVLESHVSSDDVTEEYVDTDARVRNLKRTEERLLQHLEKTGKLEDILGVERELTRVRGQIEAQEGRLRYLSHRVAFSTVTVMIHGKARIQPVVPPESFSTLKEASAAVRTLVAFAQRVWVVLIWLGVWSAVWLPITLVVWWLNKRTKN